ncbi:MAG: hypothetical protein V3S88_06160, partial [Alphaproteobacteria bacterium]
MGDLILHLEQIVEDAVVALRPDEFAGLDIGELEGRPYVIPGLLNGAVQNVANADLAARLCRGYVPPTVAIDGVG